MQFQLVNVVNVMKKYKLGKNKEFKGHQLKQIVALRDFGDVKTGDKGGFIEYDGSLSHDGNCWVYDESIVYDGANVLGNAQIRGKSIIKEYAIVSGESKVYDSLISNASNINGQSILQNEEINAPLIMNNVTRQGNFNPDRYIKRNYEKQEEIPKQESLKQLEETPEISYTRDRSLNGEYDINGNKILPETIEDEEYIYELEEKPKKKRIRKRKQKQLPTKTRGQSINKSLIIGIILAVVALLLILFLLFKNLTAPNVLHDDDIMRQETQIEDEKVSEHIETIATGNYKDNTTKVPEDYVFNIFSREIPEGEMLNSEDVEKIQKYIDEKIKETDLKYQEWLEKQPNDNKEHGRSLYTQKLSKMAKEVDIELKNLSQELNDSLEMSESKRQKLFDIEQIIDRYQKDILEVLTDLSGD